MIAFLKLIRYKNLLMVLLTMVLTKYALIESFIVNSYLSNLEFTFLVLSVLLITAGGYIINDIYDVEADIINKPHKLFIGKTITRKKAWKSYYLLTFWGLIISYLLSENLNLLLSNFLFLGCVLGLLFYAFFLKKKLILGNLLISIFVSLTIYIVYWYGCKFLDFIEPIPEEQGNSLLFFQVWIKIILYTTFAFLTTLIREIIKDIEDINGDLKIKAKTLPILIGRKRASHVAFFFGCILLVFLLMVLQTIKQELLFLSYGILFILLPLLYFLYLLWKAEKKKDFSYLSSLMKLIMFLGVLSMLLFKID
ncbi:geranylgeranylglycerol-phosphate geranylgeranyltransferase [Polaribacter sp.]|uniref:geranylgeranylglycerol-phosphate geranylgeranyltransferase n=1 Tax=Polaribacter sp. TaxID=1920175 RepID=UPI003F6AB7B4